VAFALGVLRALEHAARFIALLVNRRDHQSHRTPDIDEHRLRELQAYLDRFLYRIGHPQLVELAGVRGVTRARDDGEVGSKK
jgi:hypothetical protein